jgi:hypothetical protein
MSHRLLPYLLSAVLLGLAGCASSTVDSRIAQRRDLFESYPFDVREKIAAGRVDIGFTPDMVAMALGAPSRRVERRSMNEQSEVWYYTRSSPRISFGFGIGSGHFGRHGGFGTSLGMSTGPYGYEQDEMMRVEFHEGEVVAVDVRR